MSFHTSTFHESPSVGPHHNSNRIKQIKRNKQSINPAFADSNQTNPYSIVIRTLFRFYKQIPNKPYVATLVYITLSILIATLIICFTLKRTEYICDRIHRPTVTNIQNFNSRPQSLAIAQFNNDSHLDFVVVNTGLDNLDIYLGKDNGTFEYHKTYSTDFHSLPYSVAVGNFDNQDGIDLAVANFGTNCIEIFLGLNNGNFINGNLISTGSSRPLFIGNDDLNNDHQLDIVVVNFGTDSIGIYLGLGDGSFIFSMIYSTGYDSLPTSIAIDDLNNDNQLDIVVTNICTNNIGLFLGYGNGTFEDQKIYSTGFQSNPSSVVIDDLNNDTFLDIVVTNSGRNNIKIFFGDKDGNLTEQISYSTGSNSHPEFVSVFDVNGDNQLDIVAIDSVNERIYILPGDENGSFPLLSIYLADFGSNPVSVDGADLNNDIESDVLVVNRDGNNILLLREYNMTISMNYTTFTEETIDKPISIASGDLNGDNVLDIVVANENNRHVYIFFGQGDGSFKLVEIIYIGIIIRKVILGDLNNDHQLDIIVLHGMNNIQSFILEYKNGIFSVVNKYLTETVLFTHTFVADDINNDDCLDIIIVDDVLDMIEIYVGFCNGTFEIVSIYYVEKDWNPYSVVIDDFNNDHYADFVVGYSNSSSIHIYFGDGNGQFPMSQMYQTKRLLPSFAIVSGDFNNDNRTDVVLGLKSNEIAIFLNYENGTFSNVKIYPLRSCSNPMSMVVGDFNDDKQIDIAFSCFFSSNIAIVYGNNYGEFESQTTYSTKDNSNPISLEAGDFNNDNLLDMIVADYRNNKIGILTNYYRVDFAFQKKYSSGSSPQPYSVASADFNNDNILDLVVVNSGNKNIAFRLGFGNGSFGIETLYSTGQNSFPKHIAVADLNRDDQLDIAVVNSNGDSILIFFGYGDGTFKNIVTYSMEPESSPTWIVIADLNNDQWADLIIANQGMDNLGILYGYNYTTFVLHTTYSTGNESFPRVVSVTDINNDNRLDIIVANYISSSIGIFLGDGNGSFPTQTIYSTGGDSHPSAMTVADLNKDGCSDVIFSNLGTDSLNILLGDGNGSFRIMLTYSIGVASNPSAIVAGDVNNDNQLDVIITDGTRNNVDIFLGLGNGSLSLIATYFTGLQSEPNSIALGDLNSDNYLDIIIAYTGTDSVGVFQGYGNGSFASQTIYQLQYKSSPYSLAMADFNNDNQLDIAVANFYFNRIDILFGFGNGSFSKPKAYFPDIILTPFFVTADEFNGDNRTDIAVVCSESNSVVFLFGTEDGNFLMGRKYHNSGSSIYKTMAYGDFNNDSSLDFVVANMLDDNIDVYLSMQTEPFSTPVTMPIGFGSQPYSVAIGDFDHDNRSDIVVANFGTDNIGIILANQINNSLNLIIYFTGIGSHPYVLAIDDFNDDHHLDIAVVNSGTNEIVIFQGYGDGSFAMMKSYPTGPDSSPNSIAISDFNNDKRLDIAVTNPGANTVLILFGLGNGTFGNERSHSMGYNSRPYSIAVGNFNNDNWVDMAVANFNADYVEILLQMC